MRKIKGQRDSLGVPIEPDEYEVFIAGYDWEMNAIYSDSDEEYIFYDGDWIKYEGTSADRFLLTLGGVLYKAGEIRI